MKHSLYLLIILLSLLLPDDANARRRSLVNRNYDFTTSDKYAALVVNAKTGDVVYQKDANKELHPASLTKLMTLYLAFEAIESGQLSLNQQLPISQKASMMPKTRLGLKSGQTIAVKDAVLGLIIHSANDAAVVVAEALAGTEANFAEKMTETAHQLGMNNTTFKNASGLPDSEQITSAYDMARLAIAMRRDYAKFYPLFSRKSFKFRGSIISSHNRVLDRYQWADGLKTGYTLASGFNLITSTNRPDAKLVGVVMGGPSAVSRDNHMIQLLEYAYNKVDESRLAQRSSVKLAMNKKHPASTVISSPSAFDVMDVNPEKYITAEATEGDPFELAEAIIDTKPIMTDSPQPVIQKAIAVQKPKAIKVAAKKTKKVFAKRSTKHKVAHQKRKNKNRAV